MKGIIIYEDYRGKKVVEAEKLGTVNYVTSSSDGDWESELSGIRKTSTQAYCNKEDTYDFETGALIALMKMCGVDKVVRACNEAFSEDTFKTYAIKYEKELNELKKDFDKVKDLKEFYKKNYEDVKEHYDKLGDRNKYLIDDINKKLEYIKEKDEEIKRLNTSICAKGVLNGKLLKDYNTAQSAYEVMVEKSTDLMDKVKKLEEENEKLKLDCEKLQHGYNDMIFCGGRQNGKQYTFLVDLFKKLDQKKVDAAYKEAYGKRVVWCSSQSSTRDMLDSLIDSCKYAILTDKDGGQIEKWTGISEFTWELKEPTKREEMWEKILEIHKKSNVIIVVEKEDVNSFLHEIENRIPEITWASGIKIFEAKGTIKDIYGALKTCDRVYFRLRRDNELSYSSDPDIYLYTDFEHIPYLPPMRWDLFKKGRLAVKVNYYNYKEFYEACKKALGKKDGLFEVFTMEDQKKTGRKIVNWEDVRENKTTMEDPYDTWKWWGDITLSHKHPL